MSTAAVTDTALEAANGAALVAPSILPSSPGGLGTTSPPADRALRPSSFPVPAGGTPPEGGDESQDHGVPTVQAQDIAVSPAAGAEAVGSEQDGEQDGDSARAQPPTTPTPEGASDNGDGVAPISTPQAAVRRAVSRSISSPNGAGDGNSAGRRGEIVRFYMDDLTSYKAMMLEPGTTAARAKDLVVRKYALQNMADYYTLLVLFPSDEGSTKAQTLRGHEVVLDVLSDHHKRVHARIQHAMSVSSAPMRLLRGTDHVKIMFKDTRTPLDLSGLEFSRAREVLLEGARLGEAPTSDYVLSCGVGKVSTAGYLYKQCKNEPMVWKRCWVVVKNARLFLCASEADVRRCEVVHLGDASVRPAVITKVMRFQRIQYCLEVNTPRRAYLLRAISEESMNRWIEDLQKGVRDAGTGDMLMMADNVIGDATLVRSVLSSDLMRSACGSLPTLMRHPHTLLVLGQFLQAMHHKEEYLYFCLDVEAFKHGVQAVDRLLSEERPSLHAPQAPAVPNRARNTSSYGSDTGESVATSCDSDGGAAGAGAGGAGAGGDGSGGDAASSMPPPPPPAMVAAGVITPRRAVPRTIGGVVVDKGSDEDVEIARQRYSALCRTHLWAVATELWKKYFCGESWLLGQCGVSPEDVAQVHAVMLEVHGERESRGGVPTVLPDACLFEVVRLGIIKHMETVYLPQFVEAPFYWSLLHSLALKAVSPLHPGQSQHKDHWRRWIPKFDMMGYLHATRMRQRERERQRLRRLQASVPEGQASSGEDSAGGAQVATDQQGVPAEPQRRGKHLTHRAKSSLTKIHMLSAHKRQYSAGHIRVPSEFLAERAAHFQARPAATRAPSQLQRDTSDDGAGVQVGLDDVELPPGPGYEYTEERPGPLESMPSPLPLPSRPLKGLLDSAVPHFLNNRTFEHTYGEVHMRFA